MVCENDVSKLVVAFMLIDSDKSSSLSLISGPENCALRNVCEAREMGWSKSQCTNKDGCRLASNRRICKDRYKPVRCGPQSCKYQNMCVAKSAGYKKTECEEEGIMISS